LDGFAAENGSLSEGEEVIGVKDAGGSKKEKKEGVQMREPVKGTGLFKITLRGKEKKIHTSGRLFREARVFRL